MIRVRRCYTSGRKIKDVTMTQTDGQEGSERGYAVGVQLFDRIHESGAVYVDKTPYVWKMLTTKAVNFFLS